VHAPQLLIADRRLHDTLALPFGRQMRRRASQQQVDDSCGNRRVSGQVAMRGQRVMVPRAGQPSTYCRYGSVAMPGDRVDKIILALLDRRHRLLPNSNDDANTLVRLHELALNAARILQQCLVRSRASAGPLSGVKEISAAVALC